jgi:NAD(P)-dependent dehydrogenase (short-subunit alcohol dehydrogenase family)
MDLGLKGRTAIVCAASQGLGKASALALAREGVILFIAARRGDVLESAADEIASATGNQPKTIIADVTTKEGRDAILAAPALLPTFSSTMLADRHRAIFANSSARTGSRRLTATCWRRSR